MFAIQKSFPCPIVAKWIWGMISGVFYSFVENMFM